MSNTEYNFTATIFQDAQQRYVLRIICFALNVAPINVDQFIPEMPPLNALQIEAVCIDVTANLTSQVPDMNDEGRHTICNWLTDSYLVTAQ